jgi:quercetin dioxygenase-like cupin family protein
MTVLRLSEIPSIAVAGVNLHAVRRALGVTAFGINAFSADAGELVVEEHNEVGGGSGRHEELYVVTQGRATFTLDGEESDAPAGTFVFVPDVETRRKAVATEDGTVVLALGGPAGAAGPPSAWEYAFVGQAESDPKRGYAVASEGLRDHPDNGHLHYDLACFASRAGMRDAALSHARRAFELEPRARRWAETDADLDAIRDELFA